MRKTRIKGRAQLRATYLLDELSRNLTSRHSTVTIIANGANCDYTAGAQLAHSDTFSGNASCRRKVIG